MMMMNNKKKEKGNNSAKEEEEEEKKWDDNDNDDDDHIDNNKQHQQQQEELNHDDNHDDEEEDEDDDESSSTTSSSLNDDDDIVRGGYYYTSRWFLLWLYNELIDGWKQHSFAVLVAIIATMISYHQFVVVPSSSSSQSSLFTDTQQQQQQYYDAGEQRSSMFGMMPSISSISKQFFLPPYSTSSSYRSSSSRSMFDKHAHIDTFRRTANMTFCINNNQNKNHNPSSLLSLFEFRISIQYVDALLMHYVADILNDDHYTQVFTMNHTTMKNIIFSMNDQPNSNYHYQQEYECIMEQVSKSSSSYFTGKTYYYRKPTLESMYPHLVEQEQQHDNDNDVDIGAATIRKKKKKKKLQPAVLTFTGFGAKFVNLSPEPVLLYWDGHGSQYHSIFDDDNDNDGQTNQQQNRNNHFVGEIIPFGMIGTATMPGQAFSIRSSISNPNITLQRWIVTADNAIMYYEPIKYDTPHEGHSDDGLVASSSSSSHQQQQLLDLKHHRLYQLHKINQEYSRQYIFQSNGRMWLSHFPRHFPILYMWDAAYIGQIHNIAKQKQEQNQQEEKDDDTTTTAATSVTTSSTRKTTDTDYQLRVESVTPRVFTIQNFLSKEECQILIELANQEGFHHSTVVYGGGGGSMDDDDDNSNQQQQEQEKQKRRRGAAERRKQKEQQDDEKSSTRRGQRHKRDKSTRSSDNTWLHRDHTELTNRIYQRAANILNIDEQLMQAPSSIDDDNVHQHYHSLSEALQVVRYRTNESYTAHHDYVYPILPNNRYQSTRFCTLLLYLNDNYKGGETVFPRATNIKYHDGIQITPTIGKAVLFYNVLPDGNVDDLSQHSAEPIMEGEKYVANLWIWEPLIN